MKPSKPDALPKGRLLIAIQISSFKNGSSRADSANGPMRVHGREVEGERACLKSTKVVGEVPKICLFYAGLVSYSPVSHLDIHDLVFMFIVRNMHAEELRAAVAVLQLGESRALTEDGPFPQGEAKVAPLEAAPHPGLRRR